MAFVDSLVRGATQIDPHSLSAVKESIVKLRESPSITLFLGGKDGQMTMEFVEDMGYYISVFGKMEIEEWLACDESLPKERVNVIMSGQVNDLPRNILVREQLALDVATVFYQDGSRSSRHCWVRSVDLM